MGWRAIGWGGGVFIVCCHAVGLVLGTIVGLIPGFRFPGVRRVHTVVDRAIYRGISTRASTLTNTVTRYDSLSGQKRSEQSGIGCAVEYTFRDTHRRHCDRFGGIYGEGGEHIFEMIS